MKNTVVLLVLVALCLLSCSKDNEDRPTESKDFQFSTQEELDNFMNQTVNEVGILEISGGDISDLSSLNSVKSVDELIIDNNPKLINLKGLENLLEVNSKLSITNNRSLGNFEAIKNLNFQKLSGADKLSGDHSSGKSGNMKNLNGGSFTIENNLFNPTMEDLSTRYALPEKIYTGDLLIIGDEDLELFMRERYTGFEGKLEVRSTHIKSFIGLESLQNVERFLLNGVGVSNLEGLENLTTVGSFSLQFNKSIKNLDGIENLTNVENGVSIIRNDSLININGLRNIPSLKGWLQIYGNKRLTQLTEFRNIEFLGENLPDEDIFTRNYNGGLIIEDNESLLSLNGLESIKSIQGSLLIKTNPALKNLEGLDGLGLIVGSLEISFNKSLVDLTGSENLTTSGTTIIGNNSSLKNLNGLEKADMYDLTIDNNAVLEDLRGLGTRNTNMLVLRLTNNPLMTSLEGLNSLESIGTIYIENNSGLTTLSGLENLVEVKHGFSVRENSNLTDFCPINKSMNLDNPYYSTNYRVENNAYNPLYEEMLSDDKCKI